MSKNSFDPDMDCQLCPRLVNYRGKNRARYPHWHNGPVSSFGSFSSNLLIVGLAPGLKGANRTGRPFTGDLAGNLLYSTLIKFGFAKGVFSAQSDDGLKLVNCRITNAVRCVPPQNKVTGQETNACKSFLSSEISEMKKLKIILALGIVAHGAVLSACGEKKSSFNFSHHASHQLSDGLILTNSYHCSRYNTNTGRLTKEMFNDVFQDIVSLL